MVGQGKKDGYKKKNREQVRKVVNSGNINDLVKLVEGTQGPSKQLWMVTSFRDVGLDQHIHFVDEIISMQSDPKKNPFIWYLLTQELCFRAMFTNFNRYISILKKFPIDTVKEMIAELQHESGEKGVSFSSDYIKAKNILLCYFENYGKMIETIAALAAVASNDPRWECTLSETYLSSVFAGRYSALVPDKQESSIRNAFTHRDVIRCQDGSFVLKDLHDKKKKKSAKALDAEIKLNATRMAFVFQSLSLPSAVQYEVLRGMLMVQKGEQS